MSRGQPERVNERLDQIPVLHCRGTHRTVGFIIGRQFKSMISDLLDKWIFFNKIVLPTYETGKGKESYEHVLHLCTSRFPQYVQELEGMAEGSEQPFHKLFLLHMESTLASPDAEDELWNSKMETGCTSLLCNSGEVLLAHTEDTCPEFLNNVYIVAAEILGDDGKRLEKFTTLTYAGHLPGYTMGFNAAGLVYSINTLYPAKTYQKGTPRTFLTRAILGVGTLEDAIRILRDEDGGASDGFSINLTFAKQDGSPVMHNIEVGPPSTPQGEMAGKLESQLSVLNVARGEFQPHCNKFLRLNIPELGGIARNSSIQRHKAIWRHPKPKSLDKVKEILSDVTDGEYPIFRTSGKPDYVVTVAVGIFDILKKTWSIYINPPSSSTPILTIPMEFN